VHADTQLELAHLARRVQADHDLLALLVRHVEDHLRRDLRVGHGDRAGRTDVALEFLPERRRRRSADVDGLERKGRRLAQLEAAAGDERRCE